MRMHSTRLISAPLTRNEGPKDQKETNHPNQPWNDFQNDRREPDRDDLTYKGCRVQIPVLAASAPVMNGIAAEPA